MYRSFYWYLPIIKSSPTGYPVITTTLQCSMVSIHCPKGITRHGRMLCSCCSVKILIKPVAEWTKQQSSSVRGISIHCHSLPCKSPWLSIKQCSTVWLLGSCVLIEQRKSSLCVLSCMKSYTEYPVNVTFYVRPCKLTGCIWYKANFSPCNALLKRLYCNNSVVCYFCVTV